MQSVVGLAIAAPMADVSLQQTVPPTAYWLRPALSCSLQVSMVR
jgi:hypothetical protein